MTSKTVVEPGQFGRVAFLRIPPNDDLVEGIENAAADLGISNAMLRGSLGSVNNAMLATGSLEEPKLTKVPSLGLEIVTLLGSLRGGVAALNGALVDADGTLYHGRFVRAQNLICVTAEVSLEEWLPEKP